MGGLGSSLGVVDGDNHGVPLWDRPFPDTYVDVHDEDVNGLHDTTYNLLDGTERLTTTGCPKATVNVKEYRSGQDGITGNTRCLQRCHTTHIGPLCMIKDGGFDQSRVKLFTAQ